MEYGSATANELARLCADASNEAAWREFVLRFQRTVALTVLRISRGWGEPTTHVVDDLVQETFLRLCADRCRLLRTFVPHEPDAIIGLLRTVAAHATHDYFRAQASLKRGGDLRREEGHDEDGGVVERLFSTDAPARALEFHLQLDEMDRILRGLGPDAFTERDRIIFWLYFRQGYSAREIAAVPVYGLSEKGVESVLQRARRLLRDAMRPPVRVGERVGERISVKGNSVPFTIYKRGR